jgi:hypothetical protein
MIPVGSSGLPSGARLTGLTIGISREQCMLPTRFVFPRLPMQEMNISKALRTCEYQ